VRGKKGKPASKPSKRVRERVSDRPRRKPSNDGKLARALADAAEARAHQAATAEILRVISESPTDVQPVFDAIAESAARLFGTWNVGVLIREGDMIHARASRGLDPKTVAKVEKMFPVPFDPSSILAARAIVDGRFLEIPDTESVEVPSYARNLARTGGWRAVAFMPLLKDGHGIGAIAMINRNPGSRFTERQVSLLRTFANQAVIALQNVRAFHETREALAEQKASGEVLAAIAGSMSDTAPVFDRILEACELLFAGYYAGISVIGDDGLVHMAAYRGPNPEAYASIFPLPNNPESATAIAIAAGKVLHYPDLEAPGLPRGPRETARATGARSAIMAPLRGEEGGIGSIYVSRKFPAPFTEREIARLEGFASQATIAIKNARLFNETKEALERQTATAEILSVIASSPTDTKPVFDAIAECGARLLGGMRVVILLRKESQVVVVGSSEPLSDDVPEQVRVLPLDRDKNFPSQVILDAKVLHISDWESADIFEHERNVAKAYGVKSCLQVPLLRKGEGIGAIVVSRATVGTFHEKDIALLKSFADQAVIAIENVRLFNETNAALERQTASSEVLRIVARSMDDVQPAFKAILESALKLFKDFDSTVWMVREDQLVAVARGGPTLQATLATSIPIKSRHPWASVISERKVVRLNDVANDPGLTEAARAGLLARGRKAGLMVPLVRDGIAIGSLSVSRSTPYRFGDAEVSLLQNFADQAVIAIENVRLFNETKDALQRQTATAEILKVISSSPTDTQPVFEAIARSVVQLCDGLYTYVGLFDGTLLRFVAFHNVSAEALKILRERFPSPPNRGSASGRAILERRTIHVPNVMEDPEYQFQDLARADNYRAMLCVPMLREGTPIGVIAVGRRTPFQDDQIELVNTFADQAVIAIENVRLFKELQRRTAALSKSVSQLTALGEVGQAIGSTLDLEKVLPTIVSRAVQLTGLDRGAIYEYDEDRQVFSLRSGENIMPELVELYRSQPIRLGEGAVGGAAAKRAPVQIADIVAQGYEGRARDILERAGARALLAVPLLREGHILGALAVIRNSPGEFSPEVIELLQTFATQSAIAMQNARLFREVEEKSRQLETASQHKSQFLASMSHELRTPLNAILGFNEMMLDGLCGEVPEGFKDPLQETQTSGQHLLRLINNVLDLAKIEAGRMELALADYSVQDTVDGVRSTLKPLAAEKGLEFVTNVQSDLPLAHGDPGRLTQCLMNLAGNSLKFTKAGKVEIAVSGKDDVLRYTVTDTGIGIPPDKIGTLFTEFKQTDATIASEYGGTGLGLSITKKFIEMHGGRIWVESQLGKGSAFIFEIPLRTGQ